MARASVMPPTSAATIVIARRRCSLGSSSATGSRAATASTKRADTLGELVLHRPVLVRDLGGVGGHRAAAVAAVAMALGEIGVDIAEQVAAGPVQPGPQQGQALGEGLAASLGGERVLGREMAVEAAVGQARPPG